MVSSNELLLQLVDVTRSVFVSFLFVTLRKVCSEKAGPLRKKLVSVNRGGAILYLSVDQYQYTVLQISVYQYRCTIFQRC